jgi:hypothetical protein
MTHVAVGFGRGFPRTWIFPIAALTLILGVAATGRLSRSIVADFIAWWPVWVGIGILAYLFRDRKVGRFRVAGLIPLVALFFVGLFIWGHLAGWSLMPSASQRLVGPDATAYAEATLVARIDGRIDLSGDSDFLYVVEPIREGGTIGIPGADEQVAGSEISVQLEPPADPGLYGYAGWNLDLSPSPIWDLDLSGSIDADLTGVALSGASLSGAGTLRLGTATRETSLSVTGPFQIVVPADAPVRVVGAATVPATWTLTGDGATSATPGEGWLITVRGEGSVSISEA